MQLHTGQDVNKNTYSQNWLWSISAAVLNHPPNFKTKHFHMLPGNLTRGC